MEKTLQAQLLLAAGELAYLLQRLLGILPAADAHEGLTCRLLAAVDSQPAGAFRNDEREDEEDHRRHGAYPEHPSPRPLHALRIERLASGRKMPGYSPVDDLRGEYSQHDGQLVQRHEPAADRRRSHFGDVNRRDVRRDSDAETADDTIDDEPRETVRGAHADRRNGEEHRSDDEHFLTAVAVAPHTGQQRPGQTSHQCAAHRPPTHGGQPFESEKRFVKDFRAADYDPVVTEQKTAHRRDKADQQNIEHIRLLHKIVSGY